MMNPVNRVFPLTITTLSPLHIDSGTRMAGDVDFYSDGDTTYVLNSDVALDLVARRWEETQLPYDQILSKWQADLDTDAQKIERFDQGLRKRIAQFEANTPRDPHKRNQMIQHFREERAQVKERRRLLEERRASPPDQPVDEGLPPELLNSSGFSDLLVTKLITLDDLRGRAALDDRPLVRYVIAGRPKVAHSQAEIYEQIKDVADRPYIPGSSLKGALRSALAWAYAKDLAPQFFQNLSREGQKAADNKIEAELFYGKDGPGPRRVGNAVLRDVLRGLHVGDSTPSAGGLELLNVQIYPKGSPVAVEAIPANTQLRATLQIERYMFESAIARQVLTFDPWQQRLAPETLAASCRQRAAALIAGDREFYTSQAAEVARFYKELDDQLAGLGPRSFLLPVGWGAGWRSKTLNDRLRADDQREQEFVEVVKRYNLRKNRAKSDRFSPGDLFPATRKLIYQGNRPHRPLGWLMVEIGEEKL
ncbi:type III-A CRISPR-associated RAMP protein Csm5 [Chloroflexales bacterium ZM16-3]|nr:type III-A CRISPR-associated RAMP protein Csm5 [Chloroflexales bacterium ZM16-3]